jgi:hypothetical protein
MEVKGTAVKTIPEFVKKQCPNCYHEWLNALPDKSREIFDGSVYNNNWYSLQDGLTAPLKTLAWMFYDNDTRKAAWAIGRYSAEIALTSIYKYFIKLGSPTYTIERAGRIMNTYFKTSDVVVVFSCKNTICVHINNFNNLDAIVEYNIAGWMERALELSGCVNVKIDITQSIARGGKVTEYIISWDKADFLSSEAFFNKRIVEKNRA